VFVDASESFGEEKKEDAEVPEKCGPFASPCPNNLANDDRHRSAEVNKGVPTKQKGGRAAFPTL